MHALDDNMMVDHLQATSPRPVSLCCTVLCAVMILIVRETICCCGCCCGWWQADEEAAREREEQQAFAMEAKLNAEVGQLLYSWYISISFI